MSSPFAQLGCAIHVKLRRNPAAVPAVGQGTTPKV